MSGKRPTFVLFVLLLVAACSGGGDDGADPTDAPAADQGATGETVDGGGGQSADLGDFPIPAPPGAVVALTTDAPEATVYLATFPAEDLDDVRAFYDDWVSSQDDDYQRTDPESGGTSWLANVDGRVRIISLVPPLEGDELASVTMTDAAG